MSDIQFLRGVGIKQVIDCVQVDLEEAKMYTPIFQFSFSWFQFLKEHSDGVGDDSWAWVADFIEHAHGVGLAGARLAIYKVGGIVAL